MLLNLMINNLRNLKNNINIELKILNNNKRKQKINNLNMDLSLKREMHGLSNLDKILIEVQESKLLRVYKKSKRLY